MSDEKTIQVSMDIILNSGNAQNELMKIIQGLAANVEPMILQEKLDVAKDLVTKAHQAQTNIIQGEARGEQVAYSLLFNHAQDTLMMTQAEVLFVGALIDIYGDLNKRLIKIEGKYYENNY